jgi:oligopeptide/dipeptide ABC transporter ATP-binding protein
MGPEPILRLDEVSKGFPVRANGRLRRRGERVHAVVRVSATVDAGETVGIVGESGCGKSTLARLIVQLLRPDSGRILYRGRDLGALQPGERRAIQMVFQDPYLSLNPRMRIGDALAEPLRVYRLVPRGGIPARVDQLLEQVGLASSVRQRYPFELSGGQRQRAAIARALAVEPEVLIADEAVSSLDVSIQAQVLNLLADLRDALSLTLIMISHDLGVIEYLCDRVGVMYLGHLVEWGDGADIFSHSGHPYTRGLLESIPTLDPADRSTESPIYGELPSAIHPPAGCVFRTRCRLAWSECEAAAPPPVSLERGHWAECLVAQDVARDWQGERAAAARRD